MTWQNNRQEVSAGKMKEHLTLPGKKLCRHQERAGESENSLLTGRTPTSWSIIIFHIFQGHRVNEKFSVSASLKRVKGINPLSSLSKRQARSPAASPSLQWEQPPSSHLSSDLLSEVFIVSERWRTQFYPIFSLSEQNPGADRTKIPPMDVTRLPKSPQNPFALCQEGQVSSWHG